MKTSTKLLANTSWAILSVGLLAGFEARAANRIWNGGGVDNNWATAANWDAAIAPGDDLVFPGGASVDATSLNNTNDFVSNTTFGSITFAGTNYILRGSSILLSNGISAQSGGTNTVAFTIHLSANQQFTNAVAGGTLVIAGIVLDLNTRNLTIGTSGRIDISAPIIGSGNFTKTGTGTLRLLGTSANTYAGNARADDGLVELNKTAGVDAITGALMIGDGFGAANSATVRLLAANQINDGAAVTMEADGLLNLNNQDDMVGALVFNGGDITTGSGTLFMGGDATVNANPDSQATISGKLDLGSVTRTFNGTGHNWSPDIVITASISGNGGLTMNASSFWELALASSNSYSGFTTVNGGFLAAGNSWALGATNNGTRVNAGAGLLLRFGSHVVNESLTLNGTGAVASFGALVSLFGSNSWSGNISLGSDSTVGAFNASDVLNLNGSISGTGSLTKIGSGTLVLSGSAANSYAGSMVVNAGTLLLNKAASTTAVPGALVIGDGAGGVNADVVRLRGDSQIQDSASVTITSSGLLDSDGFIEVVGALSGTGNLQLDNSTFSVGFLGGTITFDGTISGSGNLVRNGTGIWILNGTNTFSGASTINGTTFVNGTLPANLISVFGTLGGTGTVGRVNVGSTGTISPGLSPGRLTSSNMTFVGGSIFRVELNGTTPGSGYDQLNVNGVVNLTNATLNATLGFLSAISNSFIIIDNDGTDAVTNPFLGLPEGATVNVSGTPFAVSYLGGTGNDVVLTRLAATQQPLLNIQRSANTNVVLSWATNFTGFTLEANTNLSTILWSVVSPAPAVSGTNNVVTNAAIESGKFYRLRAP